MAVTIFPSDIRHEAVSPESPPSTDKQKRFESLDGSPRSRMEKLKLFEDEEGSGKSGIEVSEFEDDSEEGDSEEEDSEEADSEDDEIHDDSDLEDYRPFRSGPDYPVDRELWKKYHKQIRVSEGFEIDDYPGFCPAAHYTPLVNFKDSEFEYNILKSLGKLAVTHFNENNNKEFHFLDIERAVAMPSGGIMYFLTIRAEDPHDADAVKILRGQVLNGIKEPTVIFCKLKGSVTS